MTHPWLAVVGALLWASAARAQQPPQGTPLPLLPESRFTVLGTSNIEPFTCRFEKMSGAAQVAADASGADALPEPAAVTALELTVPVATLHCKNDVMNNKARETLRAEAHPDIRFRLQSLEAPQPRKDKARVQLVARGELTVAGQTRPLEVPAELTRLKKDQLQVTGAVPLSFKEYGMEAPTELFGSLRANDRLTVQFDLRFGTADRP